MLSIFRDFEVSYLITKIQMKPLQTRTTPGKNEKTRMMRAFHDWSG